MLSGAARVAASPGPHVVLAGPTMTVPEIIKPFIKFTNLMMPDTAGTVTVLSDLSTDVGRRNEFTATSAAWGDKRRQWFSWFGSPTCAGRGRAQTQGQSDQSTDMGWVVQDLTQGQSDQSTDMGWVVQDLTQGQSDQSTDMGRGGWALKELWEFVADDKPGKPCGAFFHNDTLAKASKKVCEETMKRIESKKRSTKKPYATYISVKHEQISYPDECQQNERRPCLLS